MSARIVWLDNVKLLAMFLVVFEHHGLENRFVADWIWTFHLPVFFFVSGVLTNPNKSFLETVKGSAIRLLVPVLLWHLIGMLLWDPILIKYQAPNNFWQEWLQSQYSFFLGKSCGFGWFLICLFWVRLEFWILNKAGGSCLYAIGLVVLPAITFLMKGKVEVPFYVLNSFMAFPFFLVGYIVRGKVLNLRGGWISMAFSAIALCLSLYLSSLTGRYSINALDFGVNPCLMYLQGLLGVVFCVSLCRNLRVNNDFTNVLSRGTIVILLSQLPLLFIAKAVYRLIARPTHPAPYFDLASALLSSTVIMIVMYFLIKVINKHAPVLNGRISRTLENDRG